MPTVLNLIVFDNFLTPQSASHPQRSSGCATGSPPIPPPIDRPPHITPHFRSHGRLRSQETPPPQFPPPRETLRSVSANLDFINFCENKKSFPQKRIFTLDVICGFFFSYYTSAEEYPEFTNQRHNSIKTTSKPQFKVDSFFLSFRCTFWSVPLQQ